MYHLRTGTYTLANQKSLSHQLLANVGNEKKMALQRTKGNENKIAACTLSPSPV